MMNLLLDTHILLWWLNDDPTLSGQGREAIADGANNVFLSVATIWEIRIKEALGKLDLPADFEAVLDHQPFATLEIKARHAHTLRELPMLHRDPFDRMLVAQAMAERFVIVTRDPMIQRYDVLTLMV